jgi:hypothetical protein
MTELHSNVIKAWEAKRPLFHRREPPRSCFTKRADDSERRNVLARLIPLHYPRPGEREIMVSFHVGFMGLGRSRDVGWMGCWTEFQGRPQV